MCKENRVSRSTLKLLVLQRENVCKHKTGSGFIRERLMHIPEGCNALLARSAVYTRHGRVELLMYMQNYAP